MDPVTGAILGGVIEGGLSYLGSSAANRANRGMAREQMAFQERMSNTAYQRAMSDMRAAGLNPILAGKLGGASSPPGAMAAAQSELAGFGGTTSKALEARRLKSDIGKIDADTATSYALASLYDEQARSAVANTALNAMQLDKLSLEMPMYRNKADFDNSFLGKAAPYIDFGLNTAKGVAGIFKPGVVINKYDSPTKPYKPSTLGKGLKVSKGDGKTVFSSQVD